MSKLWYHNLDCQESCGVIMKEVYLKLTDDEVDDVIWALHSQNEFGTSNFMNYDTSETDALMAKISEQKDGKVRRPFVVEGIHDNGSSYIRKKVVLMAYDEKEARAYARRHLEKHSDDCFKIESVREMTEDDAFVEVC